MIDLMEAGIVFSNLMLFTFLGNSQLFLDKALNNWFYYYISL